MQNKTAKWARIEELYERMNDDNWRGIVNDIMDLLGEPADTKPHYTKAEMRKAIEEAFRKGQEAETANYILKDKEKFPSAVEYLNNITSRLGSVLKKYNLLEEEE